MRGASLHEADRYIDRATEPFAAGDRIPWIGVAAASSLIVWLHDQSLPAAAGWLVGMIVFGQIVLPPVFRWAHRVVNETNHFWLAVCCGWGLVAGLPCGVLFGTLLPWLYGSGVSSVVGGMVGLIAGPILAALEGLTLAAVVNAAIWIFTGKSLTSQARKF